MPVPSFTDPVNNNGYRWWYMDAVSDDAQHALTVIFFIGSVFSPYYARARKRGGTPAAEHCAVNVALYGAPWRWCMTERSEASLRRSPSQLSLGKSYLRIEDGKLLVSIDELAVPNLTRVRGRIAIDLPDFHLQAHPLDSQDHNAAAHFWQPIAPQTRFSVHLDKPDLSWQGSGYVDSNYGDIPLESSFSQWVWSRSHAPDRATTVMYDVTDKLGRHTQKSLHYSADGTLTTYHAPSQHQLRRTRYWRIPSHSAHP